MILLSDLHAQYESLKPELDAAIAEVIAESAFIRGRFVTDFERKFAEAAEVNHCISCANGSDALLLAIKAMSLKPGDEVITTAHSWVSTSSMITLAGGEVVFCDTDIDSFTINPAAIENAITPRTVGIIPVHLYGRPADMQPIMDIATKYGLWVIEDCAQAHLARYNGQSVGTFGDAGTYSFYPGKNLGAMGDAGAVVCKSSKLADRIARLARHGGLDKHEHNIEGFNSRMDGIQAAVLAVKLPHLKKWTQQRVSMASIYDSRIEHSPEMQSPRPARGYSHVYHQYVIRHQARDKLICYLTEQGVQTSVNYPVALPFLQAYKRFGHHPSKFPNAYRNQQTILSLPIYPELKSAHQDKVIELVNYFNSTLGRMRQSA